MQDEFIKVLPLEPGIISNTHTIQHDSEFHDQILLAFNIEATSNDASLPNVKEIIDDLNTLIKYKWYTSLSNNDLTSFLDDKYGFQISGIFFLGFIKICLKLFLMFYLS